MARITAEEKKQVRRNLLNTAAEHFAAHGLDGASINRISLDAGYAKGTVYGYFESKAALFAEVLKLGTDETLVRYRAMEHDGTTRGKLTALARADVEVVIEHEAFVQATVRELLGRRPESRRLIEEGAAPLMMMVIQILLEGRQACEVREDRSAQEQAMLFVMQITMLYAQHWFTEGTFPTWDELPELCVDLFLDGCGA